MMILKICLVVILCVVSGCVNEYEFSVDGHKILSVNNKKCYSAQLTKGIDTVTIEEARFNYDDTLVLKMLLSPDKMYIVRVDGEVRGFFERDGYTNPEEPLSKCIDKNGEYIFELIGDDVRR